MSSNDDEKQFRELAGKLKGAIDAVEKSRDEMTAEMKTLGTSSTEAKTRADEAIVEMKKVGDRLAELEQKVSRRPGADDRLQMKSMGESFVGDEKVKAFLATSDRRGTVNVSMERKNITSAPSTVGAGVSPSTSLVVADRQAMVELAMRPLVVRDLLTPGETASNNIEYPVMTSRTIAAAGVAEGALKPQSDFTTDLRSAPVRTIAHFYRASRQIMDDAPQLRSVIDAEGRYGVQFLEDVQFLYGDGTGQNLSGIIPQASAFNPAVYAIPSATNIDVLRQAILQATLALYPATGIVMHPTDWSKIETTKDANGRYIVGNPYGQLAPTLWGLPVSASMAMTPGTFVVGAFKRGAQIFDRMSLEVLLSTEDQDNFVRNLVTIRFEERLALVVYRPTAFVTGAFPS